ncbi:uncharacterized protein [Musca autumnalis]|uniref:uncharacterized protein n=1 Tax=Musca autumnalis TaxID=221902 RepID=UPI003CECA007
MRTFALIALSLVAVASAAPQFGGYGYQAQQPAPVVYQPQPSVSIPTSGYQGGEKYLPPASTTPAPIVRKQFYLVSAPEDNEGQTKQKHLVLGRPQKTYRVVFIKAPASDNANVKYSAEYAPQEEKTVIYVLSKKESELNAGDIATPAPTEASKPEVFFIKYKTPEEAEAAQREIQNEYDKLGGTNEFSDEGVAPITSVVGALDGLTPDGAYKYQPIAPSASEKSAISDYLPPITK